MEAREGIAAHPPCTCLHRKYRGTSLIRNRLLLGPYRRPVPRVLGGWAFSYGRGNPVQHPDTR